MNQPSQNQTSVPSIPSLLSVNDLAELLRVSTRTLWRLKSKGEIPHPVKFGGTVRWRGDDIKKWLNEGCPRVVDCDHDRNK